MILNVTVNLLKKLLLSLLLLFSLSARGQNRGYLVIIGGGERPAYMMQKIVDLAGGSKSKFLVIPMASSVPLDVALYQKYQLEKRGAGEVDFIICSRETADDDTSLAKLEGVKGIFFSGGDQGRLAAALVGTKFLEKIRDLYLQGGIIAGTSAGAAVMSRIMITGNEIKYPGEEESTNEDRRYPFRTIEEKNIEVKEGFGFIENAIIDQHFIRRKRHNRLISLVLEHPELLGIGIDEATALIVKPDQTFEVLGENTVVVYDATNAKNISLDQNGNLSANNIQMSILRSGQKFDLKFKKVIP